MPSQGIEKLQYSCENVIPPSLLLHGPLSNILKRKLTMCFCFGGTQTHLKGAYLELGLLQECNSNPKEFFEVCGLAAHFSFSGKMWEQINYHNEI